MHGTAPHQLGRNHRLLLMRCHVGSNGLGFGGDFEMSDTQLPKALQLAENVVSSWAHGKPPEWAIQTAAELRRLHAELAAANAALAAQGEPVAWEARFVGGTWTPCSREHYEWVKAKPHEFEGYEVRAIYTAAPAKPMTDTWADGVQAAADLLKRMANEMAMERGETDPATGAIQFKSAATREWHASLGELAEEIERLKPTHPATAASVSDVIAMVRERYRGTKWGKAAECICDAVDEAIIAQRPAQPAASVSDEREAFEAWYFENVNRAELPDYLPTLETYSSATVANLFCAWKARAALRPALAKDWRDKLADNLMRLGHGLTKTQIRDAIATVVDGVDPDSALFAALRPTQAGVPDDIVKDAQRYRWLRSYDKHDEDIAICRWADTGWTGEWVVEHDPDAAIDASMLAAAHKEGGAA